MTEATERSKLSKHLRRCGAMVIPQVPTKYGAFGVPDLLVIHRTWHGFLETKVEGNQPSSAQWDMFYMCVERGFAVAIVTFMKKGGLFVQQGDYTEGVIEYDAVTRNLLPQLAAQTRRLKDESIDS